MTSSTGIRLSSRGTHHHASPSTPMTPKPLRSIYNTRSRTRPPLLILCPDPWRISWPVAKRPKWCICCDMLPSSMAWLLGFGALSPYKERGAYRTSVEDSVYVRRDMGRKGIGQALLSHSHYRCAMVDFIQCSPEFATDNEASIALHRTLGFDVVGIEKQVGRKFNRWLDVMLLQHMLEP
jgi:GNAT superfamily N-acetyltransferase